MFQDIGVRFKHLTIVDMKTEKFSMPVSDSLGAVTAELIGDQNMDFLYVFAHGAGAGMSHPFMFNLATALAPLKIGTLRYNFPYMEKGGKRPDPPAVAEKCVLSAIKAAKDYFPKTPLLAGGKSFGGRMTSQALAKTSDSAVKGIVFVGFPLHAPGTPGTSRADHLSNISLPMLFLQGTRDALANIALMEQLCAGHRFAALKKFEGADHSFKAGKQDLIPSLAEAISDWAKKLQQHRT
jgi:uncharacterized protein